MDKKKGDFDRSRTGETGGNKKQRAHGPSRSRNVDKQNAGHGGRR